MQCNGLVISAMSARHALGELGFCDGSRKSYKEYTAFTSLMNLHQSCSPDHGYACAIWSGGTTGKLINEGVAFVLDLPESRCKFTSNVDKV